MGKKLAIECYTMTWITPEIRDLHSVIAATMKEDGTLLDANKGLLEMLHPLEPDPVGKKIPYFFIQPNFSSLISMQLKANGTIYTGLITLGDYSSVTRSLKARVWRSDEHIQIIGECDILEQERLIETLHQLNDASAKTEFDTATSNLAFRHFNEKLLTQSFTDPLTGLGNRRRLDQVLNLEIGRARRTGEKLCVAMGDLDHFKRVNDTYGHDAGDKVLITFSEMLIEHMRPTDILARFGGEEFIILMPHTDLQSGVSAVDRFRNKFSETLVEPLPSPVTVSFGLAELTTDEDAEALLRHADEALYKAKNQGRNRVATYPI